MYRNLESIAMTADNTLTTAATFPSFLEDHYTVHFSESFKGSLYRAPFIFFKFLSVLLGTKITKGVFLRVRCIFDGKRLTDFVLCYLC